MSSSGSNTTNKNFQSEIDGTAESGSVPSTPIEIEYAVLNVV